MLASRQPIVASVRRDAWVEIDLGAIEYNVGVVRSWLKPGTSMMAVVKGDGYGHGAIGVSELMVASGADWLGVASVDEGCQLRAAGISSPILILSPAPSWALTTAIESDLQLTITSSSQVADVIEAAAKVQRIAKLHVKIDTGMHRLGALPEKAVGLLEELQKHAEVKVKGLFSHLAKADDLECTQWQNEQFKRVLADVEAAGLKPDLVHMASSDATRLFADTHYDMVRPGLVLYGLESRAVSNVVKPALSVRGRINHMQDIKEGESCGYNLTWTARRPTRIASIPIGYADGIDRGLSNRLQGSLLQKRIPQIGLISMDQMLFDITDVPQAQEGDVITLVGTDSEFATAGPGEHAHTLYMATWAKELDTITYELACRLRARMPRIYTRHFVPPPRGPRKHGSSN
jgi:alanine racemase